MVFRKRSQLNSTLKRSRSRNASYVTEQTQRDAEGGLRREAAIEASNIAVGEEEGEK